MSEKGTRKDVSLIPLDVETGLVPSEKDTSFNLSSKKGQLLVRDNALSTDVKQLNSQRKSNEGRLGKYLVKQGLIDDGELAAFLSKQYQVPAIDISKIDIHQKVLKIIPDEVALKHQAIPVEKMSTTLVVAMVDPGNIFAVDEFKFITGLNIDIVVITEDAYQEAIEKYYDVKDEEEDLGPQIDIDEIFEDFEDDDIDYIEDEDDNSNVIDLEKSAEDAPVVKLVNKILVDAIRTGTSDIHIEIYEKEMRVRYRVDGVLTEVMQPPFRLRHAMISRLKIMSQLDIAERRLPQDGRIKLKLGKKKEMDFRVSVCPTLFGEKVVLRLLDKSNLQLDMTKLGFNHQQLTDFQDSISRPFGMVLVTGPTGSGKTTTLYSALAELNRPDVNISTAEDPVEFNLPGLNQVQQHEDIGLNFAATLRSFLRQDPDIIMVGEIRDFETAEIAIKAALTGHLVLSTLHTNDAPGTINRLLNMGVEPFLVTAAVNLVLAQRLGRTICKSCKQPLDATKEQLLRLGIPENELSEYSPFEGVGCDICNNTGHKGRIAFYEVMPLYDELKDLVLSGASNSELKEAAMQLGMMTLRMSALEKFKAGTTSSREVLRNTAPDFF